MESIIGIIIAVLVVVLAVGFIISGVLTTRKRKSSSWIGVVVDKEIREHVQQYDNNYNNNSNGSQGMNIRIGGIGFGSNGFGNSTAGVTHTYIISVRPDNGEVFTWDISSGFYETVGIGDRLSKPSGTLTPEIIEKAPAPVAQVPPSTPPAAPAPPTPPVAPFQ